MLSIFSAVLWPIEGLVVWAIFRSGDVGERVNGIGVDAQGLPVRRGCLFGLLMVTCSALALKVTNTPQSITAYPKRLAARQRQRIYFLHKRDSSATQKMSCHNFEIIMKYIRHAFVINNWQISSGNLLPDYKP